MNKALSLILAIGMLLCLCVTALAAQSLPPGFVALSPTEMDWHEAKDYCANQGGRLPTAHRRGGKNIAGVDGFGKTKTPWPRVFQGLPGQQLFWTDTDAPDSSQAAYLVGKDRGKIKVDFVEKRNKHRVLCVQK